MGKRKLYCADCDSDESVLKSNGVPLCLRCEAAEQWNGEHLFENEPIDCPVCGEILDTPFGDPEDEFDEERAIACGYDPDQHNQMDDEWIGFHYGYEEKCCQECDRCWGYGPKLYYDPKANIYTEKVPKTPADVLREQLAAQEAAGQLRLF